MQEKPIRSNYLFLYAKIILVLVSLSSLIDLVSAEGDSIRVATNRYVILDDPDNTSAKVGTGFGFPKYSYPTWTHWTGKNTLINATALYMDGNGFPIQGKKIDFTIMWPNGTALATISDTTNLNGLANFSFNLNDRNYYGVWSVKAANGSLSDNANFIYNWWGCAYDGNGPCGENHGSKSFPAPTTANSPYLNGYDRITSEEGAHYDQGVNCTFCHQSFDGKPGGTNPPSSGNDSNHANVPSDVHYKVSCDNASCHGGYNTGTYQHNTNQVVFSCYNSNCHTSRGDISGKSTLSSGTVSSATSLYSYKNGSTFNATFHTPDSTVPCFICHGPMHNITKPDETQRFIRNSATEDSQCTSCHSDYQRHKGSVNCTLCHSDDIHVIQVLSQNAGYVNKGSALQGNCTNCHQNSTYLSILNSSVKAGSYTGVSPPQVQVPLNHSNDTLAGQKWNNYWTEGRSGSSQYSACTYCHGFTQHDQDALGRPSQFKGNNIVGSTTANDTYWCASCHWQGYSDGPNSYSDMINAFSLLTVPPEISGHPVYGANQSKTDYYNHTNISKDDQSCRGCHGSLMSGTNITGLMHNADVGKSGGPNCVSCHEIGGSAPKHIDVTVFTNSAHRNLNGALSDVNKACYACHGDGSAPDSGHPQNYRNPRLCVDCHTGIGNYSAPIVSEHTQIAQEIVTLNATCNSCHSNGGMYLPNAGTDGGTVAFMHYLKDITDRSTIPYQHSGPIDTSNCINCHNNATYSYNESWGYPVNIATSTIRTHTETETSQCDLCHNSDISSSLGLVDFHNVSIKLADFNDCIGCHSNPQGQNPVYPAVNTGSFGRHRNVNITGGLETLTNGDCTTCHYNFNFTEMNNPGFTTPTKTCTDCHINGNYSAPIVSSHKPPKAAVIPGGKVTTTAYCAVCHNNSINKYAYSTNASVGHYGTNESLIKPTVNQTRIPRFGFMNPVDASNYNKDCNNCHNPSNSSYGNPTSITMPHINTGTCNECHVDGNASDLHEGNLSMPVTFSCKECHTTYADKYGAPNLIGTAMASKTGCGGTYCHGSDITTNSLDTPARHNFDRRYNGTPGRTDTVYLNGLASLAVTKGDIVYITSRVNDTNKLGGASRVGGAEYYIDVDPGQGKGIPMDAVDGYYNAVNGNWENVTAAIYTSSLGNGIHTVYVRGMDIGKQWSASRSAILTVQSLGYINGTVKEGTNGISGALVSTTGASATTSIDGSYSLRVIAGIYNVTAVKLPEFDSSTVNNVEVSADNETIINFDLARRSTGAIRGYVRIG